MQVSTASSKTNLSESSKQTNVHVEQSHVLPTETPLLAHNSNALSTEKLELPFPGTFDLSKPQSENTLTDHSSSPQEKDEKLLLPKQSENCGLAQPSSVIPDSLCQTAQDSPDDQIIMSTPTQPGSGSPQLDQLLSDLEKMNLKFRPETLDLPLSESSDESPEDDQIYELEDLSPEDQCPIEDSDILKISMSSVIQLVEDSNYTNAVTDPVHLQTSIQDEPEVVSVTPDLTKASETSVPPSLGSHKDSAVSPIESISVQESPQRLCEVMEPSLNPSFPLDIYQSSKYDENATETISLVSFPEVAAESQSDIPEEHLANLHEKDSTTEILQIQEQLETAISSKYSRGVTEETHLWEETEETEDFSSQSLSDLTPETVTSARHFSFEELMPYTSPGNLETSSDEERPRTSGQYSEESLTPVDSECFASQPTSLKPKVEMTSSTSDEEDNIPPGYEETMNTHMPPDYANFVHSGADSPTFEFSDPEAYFDCKQATSDLSETEPDEPEASATSSGDQPQDHLSHPRVLEKLLSSGSEDYEDAPFVHEPLYNVYEENEELLHSSEASDEEFTLCEASQLPPVCGIGAYDDTDKALTRVR